MNSSAEKVKLFASLRWSKAKDPIMSTNSARLLLNGGGIASTFIQIIFWGFRLQQDAASVKRDLTWILSCLFWFYRHDFFCLGILEVLSYLWTSLWRFSLCIIFLSVCYCWLVYRRRLSRPSSGGRGEKTLDSHSISKLKPLIFPCRTSHTRIFPRKHSFSYSYLFVGIPIGYQGSSGSLLSVGSGTCLDEDQKPKRFFNTTQSLFHVDAADYLNRGSSPGLEEKLHVFLRSQVSYETTSAF